MTSRKATSKKKAQPAVAPPKASAPIAWGKAVHETFVEFFADPSRDKLRAVLKDVAGEMRQLDFKAEWPKAGPMAKHILAMGNSGGGCLVIGVEEKADKSLEPTGLETFKDKADILNGLKNVVPDALLTQLRFLEFNYQASEWDKLVGRKFQVLLIQSDPDHLPYLAIKNGEELQAGVIYVRREGGTSAASYEEIQRLIALRLAGGRAVLVELDLKDHFEQLRVLYDQIPKVKAGGLFGAAFAEQFSGVLGALAGASEPNPNYPAEGFEAFAASLIVKKKRRIAEEIDVPFD